MLLFVSFRWKFAQDLLPSSLDRSSHLRFQISGICLFIVSIMLLYVILTLCFGWCLSFCPFMFFFQIMCLNFEFNYMPMFAIFLL
ncbi:hypothetical protein LXL04_015604 [Taraxacum kok-saghyz]